MSCFHFLLNLSVNSPLRVTLEHFSTKTFIRKRWGANLPAVALLMVGRSLAGWRSVTDGFQGLPTPTDGYRADLSCIYISNTDTLLRMRNLPRFGLGYAPIVKRESRTTFISRNGKELQFPSFFVYEHINSSIFPSC